MHRLREPLTDQRRRINNHLIRNQLEKSLQPHQKMKKARVYRTREDLSSQIIACSSAVLGNCQNGCISRGSCNWSLAYPWL